MMWNSINLSIHEQRELERGTYREILRSTLDRLTCDLSYCLSHHGAIKVSTLPIRTTSGVPVASVASLHSLNESSASAGPVESFPSDQISSTESRVQEFNNSDFNHNPAFGHGDQGAAPNSPRGCLQQDLIHGTSPSVSAAGEGQADRIVSQWQVPEGRSPWSASSERVRDNKAEISRLYPNGLEGLETPSSFRSITPPILPTKPFRPILP